MNLNLLLSRAVYGGLVATVLLSANLAGAAEKKPAKTADTTCATSDCQTAGKHGKVKSHVRPCMPTAQDCDDRSRSGREREDELARERHFEGHD